MCMYEGTLLELLEPQDRRDDNKTAFIFWDGEKFPFYLGRLTLKSLRKKARAFANSLVKELGVRPGNRLAIMLPNMLQFPVVFFGALYAGAIPVPINALYKGPEILKILQDSGAGAIVTLDRFFPEIDKIRHETNLRHIVVTTPADSIPLLKKLVYWWKSWWAGTYFHWLAEDYQVLSYAGLLMRGRFGKVPVRINSEDTALILYTSGTTGASKGVVMTHQALLGNAKATAGLVKELGLEKGKEIFIAAVPYFHIMGIAALLNAALVMRAKIVLFPVDPKDLHTFEKLLQAISYTKSTAFAGVPGFYSPMVKLLDGRRQKYNLSSVKIWISGSDKWPRSVRDKFEWLVGKKAMNGFGMSELGVVSCQRLNDTDEGSIGRSVMGVRMAILNPNEEGVGELVVQSPYAMTGYLNQPELTKKAIDEDGWMHTGDLAKFGSDGFNICLRGRKKYLIKTRLGENIDPFEVAEVLLKHPQIMDAAVVGVPDEKRGEKIRACIVLRDPAMAGKDTRLKTEKTRILRDDIIAHCKKNLAEFKMPDDILALEKLPKNAMGKVEFGKLKEL